MMYNNNNHLLTIAPWLIITSLHRGPHLLARTVLCLRLLCKVSWQGLSVEAACVLASLVLQFAEKQNGTRNSLRNRIALASRRELIAASCSTTESHSQLLEQQKCATLHEETHAYAFTIIHTCTDKVIRHMYTYAYADADAGTYAYTYTYIYRCIYRYTCTYSHTYIHTHKMYMCSATF